MLRVGLSLVGILLLLLIGRFAYLSMTTQPPDTLGGASHRLAPCPATPNCVSSQAERASRRVDPLRLSGSAPEALATVVDAIQAMPGSRVITADDGYVHAEFRSRVFRFVDDLELVYDPEVPGFQVRSASRTGRSDLGVNRKRVEALRALVSF